MSNEVVVYWSSSAFNPEIESWNFLYREPTLLLHDLVKIKSIDGREGNIFSCPASNDYFKNLYVIKSNINDEFEFPDGFLQHYDNIPLNEETVLNNIGNKVILQKFRDSSYKGYHNIVYNLEWTFFCEEPLVARFTAPTYPPFSPMEGAILASGQYDIGQWFRSFNLDYHIPVGTKKFSLKVDDPLFYLQFFTDKKVVFKRFKFNQTIHRMGLEFIQSTRRYEKFIPLYKRYEMAKKSQALKMVLAEIKNNLVE